MPSSAGRAYGAPGMASTFHYVILRTFAHATEDVEKVRQALLFAAGAAPSPWASADADAQKGRAPEVKELTFEGHHKNPILMMEVELKARPVIDRFFRHLADEGGDAVATLTQQLDRRLDDDQTFYLRLDKQDAYMGRVVLAEGEDVVQVRAKVAAFPARADKARALLVEYLEGLAARAARQPGA